MITPNDSQPGTKSGEFWLSLLEGERGGPIIDL